MISDNWVDIDIENELYNNWKRIFTKAQVKHMHSIDMNMHKLKPIGLQNVLKQESTRYISPPHPYNLRKLEQRITQNKLLYNN